MLTEIWLSLDSKTLTERENVGLYQKTAEYEVTVISKPNPNTRVGMDRESSYSKRITMLMTKMATG